jgi:hypothetical protein
MHSHALVLQRDATCVTVGKPAQRSSRVRYAWWLTHHHQVLVRYALSHNALVLQRDATCVTVGKPAQRSSSRVRYAWWLTHHYQVLAGV